MIFGVKLSVVVPQAIGISLRNKPDPLGSPLHIEKPVDKPEATPHIPKGVLKNLGHNPNARAAQKYSVVEDLGQNPCVMSTLEVLQTCPPQRKALLSALGVSDDSSSSIIKFETMGVQPHFPYYVSLLIHVECLKKTIKRIVIDEGVATYVMSLSCWKGLGSPELSQSATMLTAFNGRSIRPHRIIPYLKVQLGGKTIVIEVEVVDAPLDYNLLLGRNWMYSMQVVAS